MRARLPARSPCSPVLTCSRDASATRFSSSTELSIVCSSVVRSGSSAMLNWGLEGDASRHTDNSIGRPTSPTTLSRIKPTNFARGEP